MLHPVQEHAAARTPAEQLEAQQAVAERVLEGRIQAVEVVVGQTAVYVGIRPSPS